MLLAMAFCLSFCVCRKSEFYRNGWTNRTGFWHPGALSSTYPMHCAIHKEIRVSPKIRALLSGTLTQALDLQIFRHGQSIALSTKLVHGRARWPRTRRSTRREWTQIVYNTSVDRNALTPLMFCRKSEVQLVPTVVQQLARFRLT